MSWLSILCFCNGIWISTAILKKNLNFFTIIVFNAFLCLGFAIFNDNQIDTKKPEQKGFVKYNLYMQQFRILKLNWFILALVFFEKAIPINPKLYQSLQPPG